MSSLDCPFKLPIISMLDTKQLVLDPEINFKKECWIQIRLSKSSGSDPVSKILIYLLMLWIRIRIRNNPNVLAGSESEFEKKVRIRIQTLL
jgi:hypothetical protein